MHIFTYLHTVLNWNIAHSYNTVHPPIYSKSNDQIQHCQTSLRYFQVGAPSLMDSHRSMETHQSMGFRYFQHLKKILICCILHI